MIRRLIVLAMALCFVSACSAFDTDPTPYEGFPERDIPFNPFIAAGPYQGMYEGSMALEDSTDACVEVVAALGEEMPVVMDVIQAGNLISVEFEDGVEESGKLGDTKVTIVKRGSEDVRMYHLNFSEEGLIEGDVEIFEATGDMVEPCGSYSLSLVRE